MSCFGCCEDDNDDMRKPTGTNYNAAGIFIQLFSFNDYYLAFAFNSRSTGISLISSEMSKSYDNSGEIKIGSKPMTFF